MTTPLRFLHQWLFLMILLFSTCTHSAFMLHNAPRLSPLGPKFVRDDHSSNNNIPSNSSLGSLKDFETYFYEQTLDHFNYGLQSYATFKQKYVINSKYWGGANSSSPIFAYLGAESPLNNRTLLETGALTDNAPHFKALLVYIEHRFYGDSIPFGSNEEDFLKNETLRGYLNSAQAIADYAEIILYIKQILFAPNSPIIVIGGSYGGMLAAWFRLKYPHVAIGALASSAPILYFDNISPQDGYFSTVEKDFKEESESCFNTIQKSWDIIYKLASKPNGLSILSRKFKTCSTLTSIDDLLSFTELAYCAAAQYDVPPNYPVKTMCDAIDGAAIGTDVLGRISAGVDTIAVAFGFNSSCNDIDGFSIRRRGGWDWQTCTEMVMPIGGGDNVTIVREKPFSLVQKIKDCKKVYGVTPRPHWVTTYYGGLDIKMVLRKFGSNIIFSNGLRDPYSRGGVLEDLSDSLLAVYTQNGFHCLDIHNAKETDPDWLVMQRKTEVQIMEGWIANYYADLIVINKQLN